MKLVKIKPSQWTGLCLLLLLVLWLTPMRAVAQDNNVYQFNVNPYYPILGNLSGFGNFGYYGQPDNYSQYRFGWPGLVYRANSWLQVVGGLDIVFHG